MSLFLRKERASRPSRNKSASEKVNLSPPSFNLVKRHGSIPNYYITLLRKRAIKLLLLEMKIEEKDEILSAAG